MVAEYNCFACHHDLQEPSWRQKERGYKGQAGAFPWSEWYFFLPRELARRGPVKSEEIGDALKKLQETMARPYPAREDVSDQAGNAVKLMDRWLGQQTPKMGKPELQKLLDAIARDNETLKHLSWDEAAQLYLAAAALVEGDKQKQTALRKLHQQLAFPAGLDSPSDFRTKDGKLKSPKDLADGLGELLK